MGRVGYGRWGQGRAVRWVGCDGSHAWQRLSITAMGRTTWVVRHDVRGPPVPEMTYGRSGS